MNAINSNNNIQSSEKYRRLFDIYFEDCKVDMKSLMSQSESELKQFIVDNIVPVVDTYPPKLRSELESHKIIKKQSYKEIMNSMTRPKKTESELKFEHKQKLEKMNPKIISSKFEKL
jgi:hypothetical protein